MRDVVRECNAVSVGSDLTHDGGGWEVIVFVVSINVTDEKENIL